MRVSLIVAAGGLGERFIRSFSQAGSKPLKSKVFCPLDGEPLLCRSLSTFLTLPEISEILVPVSRESLKAARQILKTYQEIRVRVLLGGRTRAESVFNALKKTDPRNEWVMVHDGARPFISADDVRRLMAAAKTGKTDGVILARKVIPTIKLADESLAVERTIDRSRLFEAQTPQIVKRAKLLEAYRVIPDALQATDEASLLEALHLRVHLVAAESWNPKITTRQDYELAQAYLGGRKSTMIRTGFGKDTHRLVRNRKFYLGGILIPSPKGPLGHSDGDPLLHAVTDALLGAMAAGDIGDWFSDRDPRYKNIRSTKLIEAVLKECTQRGWKLVNVDSVVTLERPKLGSHKEKIRTYLAELLKLDPANVSVKAKTQEGLGPEGEGLAVTCEAVVTLEGRSLS